MLCEPRHSASAFVILGCLIMAGCSVRTPVTAGTRDTRFSLNTPLEKIAADRSGKAILIRDIPGLMTSSNYELVDDMSLSQIATVSGGQISAAKLNLVQNDLAKLSQSKP
jgi:hypothetical protein